MALEALGGIAPAFGFVFASPVLALGDCLRTAAGLAPGARLMGCTTAGEFSERGLIHGGVAVLLVATDSPHLGRTEPGRAERSAQCAGGAGPV